MFEELLNGRAIHLARFAARAREEPTNARLVELADSEPCVQHPSNKPPDYAALLVLRSLRIAGRRERREEPPRVNVEPVHNSRLGPC